MPWKVKKDGNQFCVVVSSGPKAGKRVACHETKAQAAAQVKALYANTTAELSAELVPCLEEDCSRQFLTNVQMLDHAVIHDFDDEEARQFSTQKRKTMAKKGQAMPHGGFPIANAQDLKNAIRALGRAKNPATAKAHIIKRAKALGLTKLLPASWKTSKAELAGELWSCPECERAFLDEGRLFEHAEAVHTFDDIRMLVQEGLREKYATSDANYENRVYVYVYDLAEDWVVFEASQGGEADYYKCSYSIIDNVASFGELTEVRRRTVWDPVGANEPEGVLSGASA